MFIAWGVFSDDHGPLLLTEAIATVYNSVS